MQVVLITGGAGFIGSNFIPYFLENNKAYKVVNLDLLTYAGALSNVSEIQENSRHTFIHGDICDKKLVENLFNKYQFSAVIHFAAESHVDNSITNPDAFVKTNVLGTFNLLDTAKIIGWNLQRCIKKDLKIVDFIIFLQMKYTELSEKRDCLLKRHPMHQTARIVRQKLLQILWYGVIFIPTE